MHLFPITLFQFYAYENSLISMHLLCSHMSLPERVVHEYFRSLGGKSHHKYAVNLLQYMPQEPPLNLLGLCFSKENSLAQGGRAEMVPSVSLWRQPWREDRGGVKHLVRVQAVTWAWQWHPHLQLGEICAWAGERQDGLFSTTVHPGSLHLGILPA